MSALTLRRNDFSSFFQVPFRQYGADIPYVSPFRDDLRKLLDARKNPGFSNPDDLAFFTVLRGGTPVGRITAHVYRQAQERFENRTGFFGFFDAAPDPEVARLLVEAASEHLISRGCEDMLGGFNLTASQEMGIVTSGHEHAPFMAQAYSPPWAHQLLEDQGLSPVFPMTTWKVDLPSMQPSTLIREQQDALLEEGVTIRNVERRDFSRWLGMTRELLNSSFDRNPHFVPMSQAEFDFQASSMIWVFDSRFSFVAFAGDEPIGVVACLPDVNPLLRATRSRLSLGAPFRYLRHRRRVDRASLVFGGVRPDWQGRGLVALLLHRSTSALRSAGFRELGVTWVSDENRPSLRQMEKLGASPMHRLALYRRTLA